MRDVRRGRAALVTIGCICAAALGACGGSATSSPTAAGTGSASSTPATSSSTTPASGAAGALALTVAELPSGGPTLAQISDGEMNSVANTDQRGFANADNTYRIEDDVVIDASAQAAETDYPQLRDATKSQVVTLDSSSTPSGLGAQADEYVGKTSDGYSEVGITFQDGAVIAVLLLVDSSDTVDTNFAEAVARAQEAKIAAAS